MSRLGRYDKTLDFDSGDVRLYIGPEETVDTELVQTTMDLHLACTRSQYMAMMVRCRKKDSDNSPIRVFAHPETFREYKHYILHGFPLQPRAFMPSAARGTAAAAQLPTKADKRSIRDEYEKLAQLYVLAIYPLDFSMKNTLIGAMGCAAHALQANGKPWFPEREAINIIFAGTDESDKMRSLLVTLLVDFGQGDWLPKGKQAHLQYNDDCIYSCLCGTLSQRYMSPRLRSLSLSYDTADFLIGRMRTVHSTRSIGAQGEFGCCMCAAMPLMVSSADGFVNGLITRMQCRCDRR